MTGVERVFDGPTAAFIVSAAGDELQLVDQDDLVRIIRDGLRVLPPADRDALLRQAAKEAGLRVLTADEDEVYRFALLVLAESRLTDLLNYVGTMEIADSLRQRAKSALRVDAPQVNGEAQP